MGLAAVRDIACGEQRCRTRDATSRAPSYLPRLDRRRLLARLYVFERAIVRRGSPSSSQAVLHPLLSLLDDGHTNCCTDSFCAAWCAWDAQWPPLLARELEEHGECLRRLGAFAISAPARLLNASLQLKKTGLYDFHVANAAKMVPFAGYSMPLSYGNIGAGTSSIRARRLPQSSSA